MEVHQETIKEVDDSERSSMPNESISISRQTFTSSSDSSSDSSSESELMSARDGDKTKRATAKSKFARKRLESIDEKGGLD